MPGRLRRSHRRSRPLVGACPLWRIGAYLLVGGALAYGTGVYHMGSSWGPGSSAYFLDKPHSVRSLVRRGRTVSDVTITRGMLEREWKGLSMARGFACGIPFRTTFAWHAGHGWHGARYITGRHGRPRLVAFRPVWMGIVLGALCYGVAFLVGERVASAGLGAVRRWRSRADECANCGYLLAGLPRSESGSRICPECGRVQ